MEDCGAGGLVNGSGACQVASTQYGSTQYGTTKVSKCDLNETCDVSPTEYCRRRAFSITCEDQFPAGAGRQSLAFERQIVVAGGLPVVELIVVMRTAGMA